MSSLVHCRRKVLGFFEEPEISDEETIQRGLKLRHKLLEQTG
ncbi:MAG TPA: hypothetical protein VIH03_08175 [Nitrososphaerales archaeon]